MPEDISGTLGDRILMFLLGEKRPTTVPTIRQVTAASTRKIRQTADKLKRRGLLTSVSAGGSVFYSLTESGTERAQALADPDTPSVVVVRATSPTGDWKHWYVVDGLSIRKVAEKAGVSFGTARNGLVAERVEFRSPRRRPKDVASKPPE